MPKGRSISDLVVEYFKARPKQDLQHGPVVDWVEEQYLRLYQKKPRDTWRAIRKLHQEGVLVKVSKGVYLHNPDLVQETALADFPPDIKAAIFERDNYRCVVCGRGLADGVELCADRIMPRNRDGCRSIEDGQTVCAEHSLKNYSQAEVGKRYFAKMYGQAIAIGDDRMARFCRAVFDVYDKHGIDGHVERPNGRLYDQTS